MKRNPNLMARRVLLLLPQNLLGIERSLGAAREIRRYFSTIRITAFVPARLREFADHCPYFDVVEDDAEGVDGKALSVLAKRIRSANYDSILDLADNAFTRRLKSALWPGRSPWAEPEPGERDGAGPTPYAYQILLGDLHLRDQNDQPWARLPRADLGWVRGAIRDAPRLQPGFFNIEGHFVLLVLGGPESYEGASWTIEAYSELCQRLIARRTTPVLLGNEPWREQAAQITKTDRNIRNLIGRVDLFQIVGLAERAGGAVGLDNGLLHMAFSAGSRGVLLCTSANLPRNGQAPSRPIITLHGGALADIRPAEVENALLALGAFDGVQPTQALRVH